MTITTKGALLGLRSDITIMADCSAFGRRAEYWVRVHDDGRVEARSRADEPWSAVHGLSGRQVSKLRESALQAVNAHRHIVSHDGCHLAQYSADGATIRRVDRG